MARVGHEAGTLIAAALAANAVTLLLSELVAPVPLVTAMLATLAFAGVWGSPTTSTPVHPRFDLGRESTCMLLALRCWAFFSAPGCLSP